MTIFCVGRNYVDHAKELNNPLPKKPIIFCKPATALLKDNKAFYYPDFSKDIHYELEIVLKIGKNGKSIPMEKAADYYSHIGLGIDFTARDIQQECKEKGLPWEIAKGFDNSAVLSDWLPKEELNLNNIQFSLTKNNSLVQQGESKDMIFNFDFVISYISQYFRLNVGDIIYTGTPSGVGPISIKDFFEGYIGEKRMFYCEIK
jgi:2-keto-4-pentenoate hydratase/2-oxohepta-3-ene-1,7-dioic acid hydratase in catechol pathway